MDLLFLSTRIYLGDGSNELIHGGIIVDTEGIIRRILRSSHEVNSYLYNTESEAVYDFENMVLMPGLIDVNVNINEPGRTEWEGFVSATKAAAAGGFTTIIDRPTNSLPPTTTVQALKTKTGTARGKIYVDVGFWGGLVAENINDLEGLSAAGVVGLQCSLSPAPNPVRENFSSVSKEQLEESLTKIDEGLLIAVHSELPLKVPIKANEDEPKKYESFLVTRPPKMEVDGVRLVCDLALANKKKHFHILNVSSSEVLPLIAESKTNGALLTAETAPHYLTLASENIEDCRTEFKTQPPIRSVSNQEALWKGLQSDCLNLIASNHSPATPGAKCLTYGKTRGNFLNAWPGISSLQLSLPIIWTNCQKFNLGIDFIYRSMCQEPAKLCGVDSFKGKIAEGYDADFCIWNPEEEFCVNSEMLFSTIKSTPYMNQRLKGNIHATVVRGLHVYQEYEGFGQPLGKVILRKSSKKIVKFVRI